MATGFDPGQLPGMSLPNHYELLGVGISASKDEIAKAFRSKARQVHPDKNQDHPQAEELMKQLNKAREVLSDRIKRTDYDEQLQSGDSPLPGDFEWVTRYTLILQGQIFLRCGREDANTELTFPLGKCLLGTVYVISAERQYFESYLPCVRFYKYLPTSLVFVMWKWNGMAVASFYHINVIGAAHACQQL